MLLAGTLTLAVMLVLISNAVRFRPMNRTTLGPWEVQVTVTGEAELL